MKRSAAALAVLLGTANLHAQSRVVVGDVGPGPSGRILQNALTQAHRLIEPDTGWFVLKRGERESASLIALGRTVAISGTVDGDVVVVGGDVFVRPGAHIGGRAVAIGGGVYPSTLATIGKGSESFRDNTFSITRVTDGYRLDYQSLREHASPPLLFPGVYGLRFPTYDRVNGAAINFGPVLTFAGGRGEANFLATYRSDLGKIDPAIDASVQLTRRSRAYLQASRGTFTNDKWIWPDFVNSLSALVFGTDTRNYYRADRAELRVHRAWETVKTQIEPFAGVLTERAWSVGPAVGEQRGPWSIRNRKDSLGMWRPNPNVLAGVVTSVLVGSGAQWESQGLTLRGRARGEIAVASPLAGNFTQVTSDVDVTFLTFGEQEYALEVHWVTTPGEVPPPQRYSYLGGSGTLPFHKLLEFGGDELLLIDQRYSYPLAKITLGILGMPTLLLRHRLGSAGLTRLPHFDQVLGVGVLLTFVRAELQIDPATGKTRLSAGLSISR